MTLRTLALSFCAFAAPSLALPNLAHADEAAARDEEVIVLGTRLDMPRDQAPYPIAVIPNAELEAKASLAEALDAAADIFVQAPGGRNGVASLFLRGADPNFTLVMLDGVPLNNPTNTRGGSVNVSEIDAQSLARVEIVAGPLSNVYGSGALSGAVNLITPGASAETRAFTSLGVGEHGAYSAFARLRGALSPTMGPEPLGGSLSLSVADNGQASGGAGFQAQALTAKITPIEGPGALILRLAHNSAEAFPESSGGDRYAVVRELDERESEEALLGVSLPILSRRGFRLDASASALIRRDETQTPGVAPSAFDPVGLPAGADDTRYTRFLAQTAARFDHQAWRTAIGAEAQSESGRSAGELIFFGMALPSAFQLDRATYSGFAETSRTGDRWTLHAGARLDSVEDLGEHATARAGVRYAFARPGFSLRAAAGTGFKAPSLYALSNPFVGNPDLDPEESRAFEAGLSWSNTAGDTLDIAAFHTRYADLIDFVPGPPPRLENRASVISRGASAQVAHELSDAVSARAQLVYAETFDDETGAALLNRPQWRATTMLRWRASQALAITARHSFVGARDDYAVPLGVGELSSYHTLSLDAALTLGDGAALHLTLANALDDDHEDALGFSAPGRRLGVRLSREF